MKENEPRMTTYKGFTIIYFGDEDLASRKKIVDGKTELRSRGFYLGEAQDSR